MNARVQMVRDYEHHNHDLPSVTFREGEVLDAELKTIVGVSYAIVIAPDGTERALPYSAIYLL